MCGMRTRECGETAGGFGCAFASMGRLRMSICILRHGFAGRRLLRRELDAALKPGQYGFASLRGLCPRCCPCRFLRYGILWFSLLFYERMRIFNCFFSSSADLPPQAVTLQGGCRNVIQAFLHEFHAMQFVPAVAVNDFTPAPVAGNLLRERFQLFVGIILLVKWFDINSAAK